MNTTCNDYIAFFTQTRFCAPRLASLLQIIDLLIFSFSMTIQTMPQHKNSIATVNLIILSHVLVTSKETKIKSK